MARQPLRPGLASGLCLLLSPGLLHPLTGWGGKGDESTPQEGKTCVCMSRGGRVGMSYFLL